MLSMEHRLETALMRHFCCTVRLFEHGALKSPKFAEGH